MKKNVPIVLIEYVRVVFAICCSQSTKNIPIIIIFEHAQKLNGSLIYFPCVKAGVAFYLHLSTINHVFLCHQIDINVMGHSHSNAYLYNPSHLFVDYKSERA